MFNKTDYIKTDEGYFCCLVCDDEVATFGKVTFNPDERIFSTSYENIFIVSNDKNINDDVFKFDRITIDEIIKKYIF